MTWNHNEWLVFIDLYKKYTTLFIQMSIQNGIVIHHKLRKEVWRLGFTLPQL